MMLSGNPISSPRPHPQRMTLYELHLVHGTLVTFGLLLPVPRCSGTGPHNRCMFRQDKQILPFAWVIKHNQESKYSAKIFLYSKVQHQTNYFFPFPWSRILPPNTATCVHIICAPLSVRRASSWKTAHPPGPPSAVFTRAGSACNHMAQVQALVPPLTSWVTSSELLALSPNSFSSVKWEWE